MTDLPMEALVVLARSWNQPPSLELSGGFDDRGYDRGQRAFILARSGRSAAGVSVRFLADKESPVYNPALVILGWGEAGADLSIDGERIAEGPGLRVGNRHGLEGSDLIVWIEEDGSPVGFQLTYDKYHQERALTWDPDEGFGHNAVDDGEDRPGKLKSTPILVADGAFDAAGIGQRFAEAAADLPAGIVEFVLAKLRAYQQG